MPYSLMYIFQMFLLEDSDYYTLYSDTEKQEFLFRILQHVVLGGPVNQVIGTCIMNYDN